jgi:hypothetical protein
METASASVHAYTQGVPSGRVQICYCNGSGETSTRIIRIQNVCRSRYGKTYIRAYCELRNEMRTFRLDRVLWWERCPAAPVQQMKRTYSPSPTPPTRQQQSKPSPGYKPAEAVSSPPKRKSRRGTGFLIFLTVILGFICIGKRGEIVTSSPGPGLRCEKSVERDEGLRRIDPR